MLLAISRTWAASYKGWWSLIGAQFCHLIILFQACSISCNEVDQQWLSNPFVSIYVGSFAFGLEGTKPKLSFVLIRPRYSKLDQQFSRMICFPLNLPHSRHYLSHSRTLTHIFSLSLSLFSLSQLFSHISRTHWSFSFRFFGAMGRN